MNGGPVTFRRAAAADLPALVEMLADDVLGASREVLADPLAACYAQAFEAINADPQQLLAVADRRGEVIGFLQITFVPGLSRQGALRGLIESVRVRADARGGGLGRELLQWAITQCRARGCQLVQLTTDKRRTDAKRFYESLGFSATHEGMKLEF